MQGEIVVAVTEDNVKLHGLYLASTQRRVTSTTTGDVDGAVLVHGLGGNFYSSRLLNHFAEILVGMGISVVLVNTRGHDMVNTTVWTGRSVNVGTAFEDVDHCRFDLAAWAEFLGEKGCRNVVMFGHSLGAIKALYAQAHAPHDHVKSIIALSPTRLSYEQMSNSPNGELFRSIYEDCERMVAAGDGNQPVHRAFPFPMWMTSDGYVAKYGPAETFNWLKFIDNVSIPTLLAFGELELATNPAFEGLESDLERLRAGWNSFEIETIENADHFYNSQFAMVEDVITRWLTT
jgi:pimeloyl-ACP methyl ester carboxylesterase